MGHDRCAARRIGFKTFKPFKSFKTSSEINLKKNLILFKAPLWFLNPDTQLTDLHRFEQLERLEPAAS